MHLSCALPWRAILTPTPWSSLHIEALVEGYSSGRVRTHLGEEAGFSFIRRAWFASFPHFILLQFLPVSLLRVIRPSAFPPPTPLLSSPRLPPTISLSLPCTSSGHGSLSRLQRGCVRRGDLSYFPSPLHDTQTQTRAYMHFLPMTKHVFGLRLLGTFMWCPEGRRICEFTLAMVHSGVNWPKVGQVAQRTGYWQRSHWAYSNFNSARCLTHCQTVGHACLQLQTHAHTQTHKPPLLWTVKQH